MISMKRKTSKNNGKITLQNKIKKSIPVPSHYYFQQWVNTALASAKQKYQITIRLVDEKESAQLNQTYRHKTGPTNILSFPFDPPAAIKTNILGDLVICVPVLLREAAEQQKLLLAHWAHLVIHGTLHLLGYDHIKTKDAKVMENLEIKLLKKLGFPDPYAEIQDKYA